jgi:succinate-semialdehyde dehydrogenase/glutarate-semialdehyde dehydrogenase
MWRTKTFTERAAGHRAEKTRGRSHSDRNCFVNPPTWTSPELPFGGIENSGYGRELSGLGILEFVNKKLLSVVPINAPRNRYLTDLT